MPLDYVSPRRRCVIAEESATDSQQKNEAASKQFALDAAKLASNTRCHNVAVLDVRGISPVCDYFVLASGTSARQMRTVADQIVELAEKQNNSAAHTDGYEGESWILIDFVDVIVHLFSDEARAYYDLDNLWGDAKRVEIPAS